MYEKKIPFNIDCCIKVTMEVIGGKWKCCIIDALKDGAKRPSEIHKHFPEANARVINQQLKELEMHGIIEKKIFAELPPHSEYSLTETGKSSASLKIGETGFVLPSKRYTAWNESKQFYRPTG